MLKNKEERKKFLEDDNNWNIIYNLDIGLRYSEIRFKDNISLIKVESYQYFDNKGKYIVEGYRILDRSNFTLSMNLYYISACVEFILGTVCLIISIGLIVDKVGIQNFKSLLVVISISLSNLFLNSK